MQKKDSGATFIFAVFCVGGVLAFLSQADFRDGAAGAAGAARRGSLDPAANPAAAIDSDVTTPILEGARLLDSRAANASTSATTTCRKRPLFD
jgi:hypothetical protein